ncbi:amidohydrolase [Rosenbergiella collisarenosi]|uniref:amidohydrolase n=1 Tax=Rosenbergiella collisarenosi TaxID=1544695 RepID=UPI001BDAABC5|nr:amidohydrolase [Rosenbergiella collisarenosi]MBT0722662.1 amidohydrolase [Rosenbergiella collisarenosi]
MSTLSVSVLQQPIVWMEGEANLEHFAQQIAQAPDSHLLVLPEMFTTGFAMQAATHSLSEERVLDWLRTQAALKHTAICGSAAIQLAEGAVNRFYFVTEEGEYHYYDKRHLFRMAEEHHHYQPGDRRVIIDYRGWRILPQICYDLRFPVFSRNTGNDYDLIIYVASWPAARAMHWQTLLLARAIENQSWVIGCNRVGTDNNGLSYQGDSQIISPQGEIIAQASPGEATLIIAALDHQRVSDHRRVFPAWQDADTFRLTSPVG